ncbi:MAG: DMT family transporter, partial [Acidimicrobiia bacterium]|nr:DMT family transporter [Acidimicrobiia bacterium]
AVASISFVVALSLTSVANTLIILSTAPLFAAVLGRVLLGEGISPRTWMAILVAVAGVAMMVKDSFGRSSHLGNMVAFIVPVAFALATVVIRRQRHVRMTPAMAISPLIALLVAIPLVPSFAVSGRDLVLLAFFGCGQLGTGMALYAIGARMAPPAKTALVSLLETVVGPIWVWLVVGEVPGPGALVGGAIVLAAMAVHTAFDLRRPVSPQVA